MKNQFTLNNNTYPFRLTMGAMVRFKQMMGYEISDLNKDGKEDSEGLCAYFYCMISSACNSDGVEFPYKDFLSFCDAITPADIANMMSALAENNPDEDTKKKKKS